MVRSDALWRGPEEAEGHGLYWPRIVDGELDLLCSELPAIAVIPAALLGP